MKDIKTISVKAQVVEVRKTDLKVGEEVYYTLPYSEHDGRGPFEVGSGKDGDTEFVNLSGISFKFSNLPRGIRFWKRI